MLPSVQRPRHSHRNSFGSVGDYVKRLARAKCTSCVIAQQLVWCGLRKIGILAPSPGSDMFQHKFFYAGGSVFSYIGVFLSTVNIYGASPLFAHSWWNLWISLSSFLYVHDVG